jgi:hypothetical protein
LDIEEGVARIRLLAEHAAEFEVFDGFDQRLGVGFDRGESVVVTVGFAHLKKFGVVGEFLRQTRECDNDAVEQFLFTAEFLGFFRVVPDFGVF